MHQSCTIRQFIAATSSSAGCSIGQSVHKNFPLFGGYSFCPGRLKLGMEVKCVYVCVHVEVCVCVDANWLKGGMSLGVAYCKKAHIFLTDSQSWKKFTAKVGHEPKDSWLTVRPALFHNSWTGCCKLLVTTIAKFMLVYSQIYSNSYKLK